MEHFLACHEHGFAAFRWRAVQNHGRQSQIGGSAARLAGAVPVFNPRYLDFARHHGFAIAALQWSPAATRRGAGGSGGIRQKEFLAWARVDRLQHRSTPPHRSGSTPSPTCASTAKRNSAPSICSCSKASASGTAQPAPPTTSLTITSTSVASSQFRITQDTNQYSVPSAYAHRRLTVQAYPDRICIYFDNQLIARHPRRYGRHEDIEGSGTRLGA